MWNSAQSCVKGQKCKSKIKLSGFECVVQGAASVKCSAESGDPEADGGLSSGEEPGGSQC